MVTTTDPGGGGPATSAGPSGSDPAWSAWIKPGAWEVALLTDLGLPITHSTVTALDGWAASEGTAWANNPLAISGMFPGATGCIAQCGSGSPIMKYATMTQGVAATARFLEGNNYSTLLANFRYSTYAAELAANHGKPGANFTILSNIWASINASGWCRGCQGGKYPEALLQVINGGPLSSSQLQSAAAGLGKVASSPQPTGDQGAVTPGVGPITGPGGLLSGLGAFGTLLGDLGSADFWKRLGIFVLGAALAVVGLVLFVGATGKRELDARPELALAAA